MSEAYRYTNIPSLEELLPRTGGRAGVTYAMINLVNARKAQDDNFERLAGNMPIYTIVGPKGEVNFELWGKGQPIPGQDPTSSRCRCFVDGSLYDETGLQRPGGPKEEPKTSK